MTSYGYIYKINFPNGKHYIGLTTTSLKQRTNEHKKSAKNGNNRCVYNAIRRYDMVDTLELIQIDTADTDNELCEKEIEYIIEYNSYYMNNNGYNMTHGGEGVNGYVITDEVIQRIKDSLRKYYLNHPEAAKVNSERMKNYFINNPEAKQNLSEAHTLRFANPQERKMQSERLVKYYLNRPEAKDRMRETRIQYFLDKPEARQKVSEMGKIHFANPEARQQMSEIKKKYNEEHPEVAKKHGERMRIFYKENPEDRRKCSNSKVKNKPFDVLKTDGTFIKTFTYQFEAKEYLQKEFNIRSIPNVSQVLSGKRKSTCGFIFKYLQI